MSRVLTAIDRRRGRATDSLLLSMERRIRVVIDRIGGAKNMSKNKKSTGMKEWKVFRRAVHFIWRSRCCPRTTIA